ncbi:hypothetical protein Taro_046557 [Colocasia esculenta]|uniref:Uncharacterized protein n=1 Tax=Colocasia esculenta TaxID=4460 RepID=A0A843WSR0_COLES|nr:hypothetical protein [Colocasia esculenta]
MVSLPDYAGCPNDRVRLPDYVGCPDDRFRIMLNSITCPIPFSSRGRDPSSSSGGGGGSATWTPTMLDFWCHELERAPTFRELFYQTHKRKGTYDYVSESDRTNVESYGRTMADHYAEGTPQPDLDPEAWADAAGGPRKGQVYGFGDSLDTTLMLSSCASSVTPPTYASLFTATPDSGGDDIRTLSGKSCHNSCQ